MTDLLSREKDSTLNIIIYPAPKAKGRSKDKSEADESVKPPVSYGWDWHPRLIISGLYEECYLEVKPATHIVDAEMRYVLSSDLSVATITLEAQVESPTGKLEWKLLDKNGNEVCNYKFPHICTNTTSPPITFKNPELWWPLEHGDQVLYTSIFTLTSHTKDEKTASIGFRRCKLVPNENAKDKGFPMSANLPPITMEINNRKIFCKGTNWVEPEIFTGLITRETYEPLIKLAKDAHFNMLRTWGGCMVSKESFFDLCDEYGLLVWQEFPLSCNNYRDIPYYLEILDRESVEIIKRVRRHPCLAIWCGGNELFNDWSGMTDQAHALRLLNANCYAHDPFTPFLPTSPVAGMAHGCYVFRYTSPHTMSKELEHLTGGYDCLTAMIHASNTAYTEFGCPSASDVETLQAIIPKDELFPPKPGGSWQHHHAFYAWGDHEPNSWLNPNVVEHYFGTPDNLAELVDYTQMLQCIGYKGIYEEARRQWPNCSMALNWDYNEPWPTAAGNNLITYPAKPKPAYYAVRESCRQQMTSARVAKFDYVNGEMFAAELFILNDLPEVIKPLTVKITLTSATKVYDLGIWETAETHASCHQKSPMKFTAILNEPENTILRLKVEVVGNPHIGSEYLFLCKNVASTVKVLPEKFAYGK